MRKKIRELYTRVRVCWTPNELGFDMQRFTGSRSTVEVITKKCKAGRRILEENSLRMILEKKVRQLKQDLPTIYLARKGRDIPVLAKTFAIMTVVYALSPIDLMPDSIPALGLLDGMILLPALIVLACKPIPDEIWGRSRWLREEIQEKK